MKIAKIKTFLKKVAIAIIAVLVASLIREFLLNSLEEKVIWITFYPAVMIVAIIGGFFSGILTFIFTNLIKFY